MNTLGLSWFCLKLDYSTPLWWGHEWLLFPNLSLFDWMWKIAKVLFSPYCLITILWVFWSALGVFIVFSGLVKAAFFIVLAGGQGWRWKCCHPWSEEREGQITVMFLSWMVNDGDFYLSKTKFWKLAISLIIEGVLNYAPNLHILVFPVMLTKSMGLTFLLPVPSCSHCPGINAIIWTLASSCKPPFLIAPL